MLGFGVEVYPPDPRLAKGSELVVVFYLPKMSLIPPPPPENGSDLVLANGSAYFVVTNGSGLVLAKGSAGLDMLLPKGSDAAEVPPPPMPFKKASMSPSLLLDVYLFPKISDDGPAAA